MKLKYFLISVIVVLLVSCTPMPMYAQLVVADPGSLSQRITLFLEELAEAMNSRYTLEEQKDKTTELVEQNKESLEKLRKISNYIQTALVVQEIAEESNEVIEKIRNINEQFSKLDKLTKEEVYNVLNFSMDLSKQVLEKVSESKKMSKNGQKSGEMTDYERLQVLNDIKAEIVKIKKNLTEIEKRFKSKNSYETFTQQARAYTREALFMAFEATNETDGIKKSNTKSSTKTTTKSSSAKSTSSKKTK